ncbi:MAG TPA: hypothetical protein VJX66_10605, partial [Amycolatopsis sp.]|nr:hypothetical protein [Amycolatopsis sp.]
LQLRLLETVVQVAAEKNSTLVLPFPVELLRFLDHATRQGEKMVMPKEESANGQSAPLPRTPAEESGTESLTEKRATAP